MKCLMEFKLIFYKIFALIYLLIFANDTEIGKVLINDDYPFALIKFLDKNFDKNKIFKCKNGSIKVLIPDWLEISS